MLLTCCALWMIGLGQGQVDPVAVDVMEPWPYVPASGSGLTMLGQDPGAATVGETPGVLLRHRWSGPLGQHVQDWGLFTGVPLGTWRFAAGWVQQIRYHSPVRSLPPGRLFLQLGWQFNDVSGLGFSYQGDLVQDRAEHLKKWSVGWYQQWLPWLTSSFIASQLHCRDQACSRDIFSSAPAQGVPSLQIGRLQAGFALRPILGSPWLTLATAGQIDLYPEQRWREKLLSATLLIQPSANLLFQASGRYDLESQRQRWWLGATLPLTANFALTGGGGVSGSFASMRWQGQRAPLIDPPAARSVTLRLGGTTLQAQENPWQGKLPISRLAWDLTQLAQDKHVAKVCLDMVEPLQISWALAQELRAAVQHLVLEGKEVTARLRRAEEMTYIVASGAQRIEMDGAGGLELDGFVVEELYLADALQKLGIQMEGVTIGQFKSAPDMFKRQQPREETIAMEQALLAQADALLLEALNGRQLAAKRDEIVAKGLFTPQQAQSAGLIDSIVAWPEAIEALSLQDEQIDWQPPIEPWLGQEGREWQTVPTIAVLPIVGTLRGQGPTPGMPFGANSPRASAYIEALKRLDEDDRVHAIVLRIDSPGGDVDVAEDVWRMVRKVDQHKPILASLGGVAASGGYYIASAARTIVAEPSTITGSIGVFMLKPNAAALLERLGVGIYAHKGQGEPDPHSWLRPWTMEQQQRYQDYLSFLYGQFIERVAIGRKLSPEQVESCAQGRVWTGQAAHSHQLVDHLGGLVQTLALAQQAAQLKPDADVAVMFYRYPQDILGTLVQWSTGRGSLAVAEQLTQQFTPLLTNPHHPWLAMAPMAHWLGQAGE